MLKLTTTTLPFFYKVSRREGTGAAIVRMNVTGGVTPEEALRIVEEIVEAVNATGNDYVRARFCILMQLPNNSPWSSIHDAVRCLKNSTPDPMDRLAVMSQEERAEWFDDVRQLYCMFCGADHPHGRMCLCWDDVNVSVPPPVDVHVMVCNHRTCGPQTYISLEKSVLQTKAAEIVSVDAEHWNAPEWVYDGKDRYSWGEDNSIEITTHSLEPCQDHEQTG